MKKIKLTHLSPIDFDRRSRWRKQQLWMARLINAHGLKKAREIVNKKKREIIE